MTLPPNMIGALIIVVIFVLVFRLGRANRAAKEVEAARAKMADTIARSMSEDDYGK